MPDSAIPGGFSRVDEPEGFLVLNDRYRSLLLDFFSSPPTHWSAHPEAAYYTGKGRHFSVPLTSSLGRVFVRRWAHGGGVRLLGRWFSSPDRAFRELDALARAHRAGIPVPEPLALRVEKAAFGCRLTTVTREVKADGDLPAVLGSFHPVPVSLRRALARRFGEAVGALHRAGVFPADLHLRNVLVKDTDVRPDLCLVDLDPVPLVPPGGSGDGPAVASLARLLRSCRRWKQAGLRIARTDPSRFLRGYADAAGLDRNARRRLVSGVLASPAARVGVPPRDARGVTVLGGPVSTPSRVLLCMPNWLGDAVMAMPLLEGLRRAWPEAVLSVLTIDKLGGLYPLAPVSVETLVRGGPESTPEALRRRSFDLVLSVPRSLGAAWRASRCGGASRVGFDGVFRRILYTHRIHTNGAATGRHRVESYWSLLSPFGLGPFPPPPRLVVPGPAREEAETLLRAAGIGPNEILVGLNPGAAYGPAKQWPVDRFAETARALARPPGRRILLFGSAAEAPIADAIVRETGVAAVSFAGRTSLGALAALIARCRIFITNDTGPMHMAAALDVPVAALFGSTDPVATGPYGPRHRVVREPAPCAPCLLRRCPIDFRCMRAISCERVIDTAERMIA